MITGIRDLKNNFSDVYVKFSKIEGVAPYDAFVLNEFGYDPATYKNKCHTCGCDIPIGAHIRADQYSLKKSCSKTCELKRRHSDRSYTKNITNKSVVSREVVGDDGLTPAKRGALAAADTKRANGSYSGIGNKISAVKQGKSRDKKRIHSQKFYNICQKYSTERVILTLFSLSKREIKTEPFFYLFLAGFQEKIDYEITFDKTVILENLKHRYYKKYLAASCEQCNSIFDNVYISKNKIYTKNSRFCCKECKINHSWTEERRTERAQGTKVLWMDRDYNIKVRDRLSESYNNKSFDERKSIIDKRVETNKNKSGDFYKEWGDKMRVRRITNGHYIDHKDNEQKTAYNTYKRSVISFTKKNVDLSLLENYEFRGKHTFHLDHIFPVSAGFLLKIPAYFIGSIDNLRFLPASDNRKKSNIILEIPDVIVKYIETCTDEIKELYENLKNRS